MLVVADDFFGFDAIPIGDQGFQVFVVNRRCFIHQAETSLQNDVMIFTGRGGDSLMKL